MPPSDAQSEIPNVPFRDVELPPVNLTVDHREDGSILLKSAVPLVDFDANIIRGLYQQEALLKGKTLYAQRILNADGSRGDWVKHSFRQTKQDSQAIAQWLIDRGLGRDDPVLILSGNSIAHAMMRLGALTAGLPACPISPNYALVTGTFDRLKHVVDLVKPKVIFAESIGPCRAALNAIDLTDRIVISRDAAGGDIDSVAYDEICRTPPGPAVEARVNGADVDAHAVYMLTSGSTGMPKAVVQTQRMLSTNMHQAFQVLGKAAGWDDVMLDWLPWNHVSGAFNLFAPAIFGGTLYIDDGKPAPGLFDETIRNLREISVPYFANVPAGFAFLVDALESDQQLRETFFRDLRLILYGGAGLPQPVHDRLQNLAIQATGRRIFMTTGYGATETTSGCMVIHFDTRKVGIGLPTPGVEIKLVPTDDRYELRMRGDNIMPGYLRDPEQTAAAFDDEGFYRTGDATRFHDPNDFNQGLYFAGRLTEEFKLGTGTWVYAGQVRTKVIEALAPAITDLVLCGSGWDSLAVLGVPSLAGLRELASAPDGELGDLVGDPKVTRFLRERLASYNAQYRGNSTAVHRFSFVHEPPNADKRELSDKGTVNQAIAAENRLDEIEVLYRDPPAANVIVV